jgi:DNA-binding transcriptional ArsR family regulator
MSAPDDELDPVWRALANPMRRRMVEVLRQGRLPTAQLATHFRDVSRFAVMQHLEVLVAADLVVVKREGRTRWNYLNPVPIRRLVDSLLGRFDDAPAAELEAMRKRIESPAPAPAVSRRPRRKPARTPAP